MKKRNLYSKTPRSHIQHRTLRNRLRRLVRVNWPLARIYLLFALTLLILFTLTMIEPLVDNVLTPFNAFLAWSSAAMLSLLGSESVVSAGVSVSGSHFSFGIAEGCNGVYALVVVIAGIVAFPARWRAKGIGLLLGTIFVMSLNYVRILTLWYAGSSGWRLYDALHTYLWEFVIIALGAGFLYFWHEKFVKES